MKKKQKESIMSLQNEELTKKTQELRLELEKKYSERYTKQSKNTRMVRNIRKEIALAETIKRKNQMLEAQHGA